MLYSISGSQGQGKSTVVRELEKLGTVKVLVNNVSRGILRDWGYTLNEVNKYGPLTRNFQEEIMNRFVKIIDSVKDSPDIYITERSFADIFAYTIFVLGPFNEHSVWLDEYYERCKHHQRSFAGIFYLTGREYIPEDDGVRSVNKHYAGAVDRNILQYLGEFDYKNRVERISTPDLNSRVSCINSHLVLNGLSRQEGII